MDPDTGCGLPSTGEKAIGEAHWFWNSIGWILAASVRALAWMYLSKRCHTKGEVTKITQFNLKYGSSKDIRDIDRHKDKWSLNRRRLTRHSMRKENEEAPQIQFHNFLSHQD